MPQTINVLFLAAEAEPFVKVGGLGDVAGTLPRALRALSNDEIKVDVRLVLPQHTVIRSIHPITNLMRKNMRSFLWPRLNCRVRSTGLRTSFTPMIGIRP